MCIRFTAANQLYRQNFGAGSTIPARLEVDATPGPFTIWLTWFCEEDAASSNAATILELGTATTPGHAICWAGNGDGTGSLVWRINGTAVCSVAIAGNPTNKVVQAAFSFDYDSGTLANSVFRGYACVSDGTGTTPASSTGNTYSMSTPTQIALGRFQETTNSNSAKGVPIVFLTTTVAADSTGTTAKSNAGVAFTAVMGGVYSYQPIAPLLYDSAASVCIMALNHAAIGRIFFGGSVDGRKGKTASNASCAFADRTRSSSPGYYYAATATTATVSNSPQHVSWYEVSGQTPWPPGKSVDTSGMGLPSTAGIGTAPFGKLHDPSRRIAYAYAHGGEMGNDVKMGVAANSRACYYSPLQLRMMDGTYVSGRFVCYNYNEHGLLSQTNLRDLATGYQNVPPPSGRESCTYTSVEATQADAAIGLWGFDCYDNRPLCRDSGDSASTVIAATSRAWTRGNAAISSFSAASPTVVTTSAAHGLQTGDYVTISGATGGSPGTINATLQVTVTGSTTFTVPVDLSGGAATGGTMVNLSEGYMGGRFGVGVRTGSDTTSKYLGSGGGRFIRPGYSYRLLWRPEAGTPTTDKLVVKCLLLNFPTSSQISRARKEWATTQNGTDGDVGSSISVPTMGDGRSGLAITAVTNPAFSSETRSTAGVVRIDDSAPSLPAGIGVGDLIEITTSGGVSRREMAAIESISGAGTATCNITYEGAFATNPAIGDKVRFLDARQAFQMVSVTFNAGSVASNMWRGLEIKSHATGSGLCMLSWWAQNTGAFGIIPSILGWSGCGHRIQHNRYSKIAHWSDGKTMIQRLFETLDLDLALISIANQGDGSGTPVTSYGNIIDDWQALSPTTELICAAGGDEVTSTGSTGTWTQASHPPDHTAVLQYQARTQNIPMVAMFYDPRRCAHWAARGLMGYDLAESEIHPACSLEWAAWLEQLNRLNGFDSRQFRA